ncbi:hypothetical protein ABT075_17890 [Streptomyces sp. NPDC002677]|uniref:hypothetical protein n=1 Tax=Streptomyces sp. NPDC002677 TaxID=3154774 RepID=UPI003316F1D1
MLGIGPPHEEPAIRGDEEVVVVDERERRTDTAEGRGEPGHNDLSQFLLGGGGDEGGGGSGDLVGTVGAHSLVAGVGRNPHSRPTDQQLDQSHLPGTGDVRAARRFGWTAEQRPTSMLACVGKYVRLPNG